MASKFETSLKRNACGDLSKRPKSVTAHLEQFLIDLPQIPLERAKKDFEDILNRPDCNVSKEKKYFYLNSVKNVTDKNVFIQKITNIYLAGCNLRAMK